MPEWFWPTSKTEGGIVVRLGRALHWLGYGAAAFLMVAMAAALTLWWEPRNPGQIVEPLAWAFGFAITGRLARYIIAAE